VSPISQWAGGVPPTGIASAMVGLFGADENSLATLRTRRGPQERREDHMLFRGSIGAAALIVALLTATAAQAFDDAEYPNLKGQWHRAEGNAGAGRFDPTKPPGRLQEVPLTAEYQAIYEGNIA